MLNSEVIKRLREALGLTRTEFAYTVGVSFSALQSWELGRSHPRWETMEKIYEIARKAKIDVET